MALFTATQNGDMDDAATFGGAGTPVSGDEIALGGYTVSCSSDKRALASGITISGTGTLLILSGGAFKTAANIPATCTLQFGEPEGTGAGPLPASGALDANASGEVVLNGGIVVLGPVAVYTASRTGRGWGIVTGTTSSSISVLDEATTDWQSGDAVTPFGLANAHEYIVSAWDSGAKTLTHSAVVSGYNAVGVPLVRMSCAAHIRRTTSTTTTIIQGGLAGSGDLYVNAIAATNSTAIGSRISLHGRAAINIRSGGAGIHSSLISSGFGSVSTLYCPGYFVLSSSSKLRLTTGGIFRAISPTGMPGEVTITGATLLESLSPPSAGNKYNATLIDCTLPSPLISGALVGLQTIRVMSGDGISDVLHSAGGVATKVQHASLPGINDLPHAFLLAPVSGRAVYDFWITVRRGQSVRIRFHAFRTTSAARCGYDIYDDSRDVEEVSTPLQTYELPTGTEILEWQRPTPEIFYNSTERELLLRVRAWATGDNTYARCSPEQGGGEL